MSYADQLQICPTQTNYKFVIDPNEAHHVVNLSRAQYPPGARVQCTYIEIPQVAETYAVLLAKPFWIWGAEMGANEFGVVIGNEAVFTKIPYEKKGALIGMDLLRLALERAQSARAALNVITALLAQYGQGGNCGFQHASYYHNSFLSNERQCRTTDMLNTQRGTITMEAMMRALRDHGAKADWSPAHSLTAFDVCAHAGYGPIRATQTTGSMVSQLAPARQTHLVTATAAPCASIFKPVWLDMEIPDTGPAPQGTYDAQTLFWRHEQLHRATLRDYAARHALYRDERDALEREFVRGALECADAPPETRNAYARACFARADAAERAWLEKIRAAQPHASRHVLYERAWKKFNRTANMPAE